jgi:hypothetical protein
VEKLTARRSIKDLAAPGLDAIRRNARPILLIQFLAAVFLICYYQFPSFKTLPPAADGLKSRYGFWYLLVAVWVVSIVVPEIAKLVTRQTANRLRGRDFLFLAVHFGILGIFLDAFYVRLDKIVGHQVNVQTVIIKVAIDQLFMSILVTMPFATICFLWRDCNYSFSETRLKLKQGEYWVRFWPTLVTCWMYFGPFTIVIYSLPQALNYPISMAAEAAWSLILVTLGTSKAPETS